MNPPPKADAWLRQYGDYLFSIAMLKTRDRSLAEDLVQETFLSALKGYDNFRQNSSEKTWLTSILKNKIIDHFRKKDVLKNTDNYLSDTDRSFYDHFFSSDTNQKGHWLEEAYPQSWEAAADHSLLEKEFSVVIEFCLSKLPSKLLPVFVAKFIDEENPENICKEFNLTTSNYWVILHRTKLLMRACLEEKWMSR